MVGAREEEKKLEVPLLLLGAGGSARGSKGAWVVDDGAAGARGGMSKRLKSMRAGRTVLLGPGSSGGGGESDTRCALGVAGGGACSGWEMELM